jgi:hypothetical protein
LTGRFSLQHLHLNFHTDSLVIPCHPGDWNYL